MDGRGLRALLCVLVVVMCSVAFGPVAAGGVADASTQRAVLQENGTEGLTLEDADRIHIDVFIAENGTALVTVDYQFHLDDGNSSQAEWERLREDIESNRAEYTAAERAKWNDTVAEGENETEREMNVSNVSLTTEVDSAPREIGHVTVTFRWSSFALVQLNRIEAGAALSGFTLDDGTTLQFRWPEAYTVYQNEGEPQVEPSPSDPPDGSVAWQGETTTFTEQQPRIVLIKNDEPGTAQPPSDEGPAMPWAIVLAALTLLAVVGATGWVIGRKRNGGGTPDRAAETARRTDGSAAGEPNVANGPPTELLSNEERVLRLLEERGGRIKQQEVVSELGWTEAKTSQVVGDLRENDEIEVFRIGRENVLSLPDDE